MIEKPGQPQTSNTLAQLLLGAKIVKPEHLEEAQKSAKRLDVPLERALIMLQHASENMLRPALQADAMVKKGKITPELAIRAIIMARQNNVALEEAISVMGAVVAKTAKLAAVTNPLTELLLSSEMITGEQLGQIIKSSSDTGMLTARTIVFNRYLSRWAVMEALTALMLVRDGKVSKEAAIKALKAVMQRRIGVVQTFFEQGQYHDSHGASLRLGELFGMANFLSESDLMDCFEIEVCQNKPFGQVIVDQGLVNQNVLEAACSLLDMVQSYLRPFQAAEALRSVRAKDISVYQALAELQPPPQMPQKPLRVGDLIAESGLAARDVIEKSIDDNDNPIRVGKKLLSAGLLSEQHLFSVLRSQSLFKEGLLSADNTIQLLKTCVKEGINVDEALQKLGWNIPPRMQWSWS